jgi:hypothetical protein
MSKTRIQIAKSDIVSHFASLKSPVLRLKEIAAILSAQRGFWRLTQSTNTAEFIDFLSQHAKLKKLEFEFPHRPETCYTWGDVPLFEVLLHLKKGSYFSHYTAMRTHGLTEQVPKSVYLTVERKTPTPAGTVLDQQQINEAFARPPRISNNVFDLAGRRIHLLGGQQTKNLGVVTQELADGEATVLGRVTDLERTLIDITVRPFYAGGVFEVAKAFELAQHSASINKLVAMLKRLNFIYPVHQAIGYYAERAGYKASQLDLLKRLPMAHDFFLSHAMTDTSYVKPWRLYVPNGF